MANNDPGSARFGVRAAQPRDIPALMRLKRLLAQEEDSLHALRATEEDWRRDGFGADPGFTAFVAESADGGVGNANLDDASLGDAIIGMATCSQRLITGWTGPVIFLQDLFVEAASRDRGVARALMARVAAFARDLGSPIVELTVRAENPAQHFYLRSGFQPLPQCLTYVLAGPALAALADRDMQGLAPAGSIQARLPDHERVDRGHAQQDGPCQQAPAAE